MKQNKEQTDVWIRKNSIADHNIQSNNRLTAMEGSILKTKKPSYGKPIIYLQVKSVKHQLKIWSCFTPFTNS